MKLNLKKYQINIFKNILKEKFLLLTINSNQNSQKWLTIEQNLYELGMSYTKIYNNPAIKIVSNSIFKNFKNTVNSTFFLLIPSKTNKKIIKSNFLNGLTEIQFTILFIKLNKKIHTISQLTKINSFNYKKNVKLAYQFLITTLKTTTQVISQN